MKALKQYYWTFLVALSAGWWLADRSDWARLEGFFAWREVLTQYSGFLAVAAMSLALVLAVRPTFLERPLGGLDKMYRLHKWLGIAGLAFAVGHWLLAKGPHWLVDAGLLTRPPRGPHPAFPDGSLQQLLGELREPAEGLGEWAFYAAALLMALALAKRFPYRRFFQTHKLLAAAYLVLAFHAVVLLKFEDWPGFIGLATALLVAAGSVAAVMALAGKRAGGRQVGGEVAGLEPLPAAGVLAVDVRLDDGWPGHEAGQFAFATFHAEEGPHPFTIASAWQGDGRLRFLVKGLGDYTRSLPQRLARGDRVSVEGPYGRFDFAGERRQIWIGGGIGITPFIARLESLARAPDGKPVDLFHTTAAYDPAAIDRLTADAAAAQVRLHVLWDERDGRLDAARLCAAVPQWREADVWFCGPAAFGRLLKKSLTAMGLPEARFHQELFEMR